MTAPLHLPPPRLRRLPADDLPTALGRGALLVDIRSAEQRAEQGGVVNALVIAREGLVGHLDPHSADRIPEARHHDIEWVILCAQGYSSAAAVAALHDIGLHRATDVIGGYQALRDKGILV